MQEMAGDFLYSRRTVFEAQDLVERYTKVAVAIQSAVSATVWKNYKKELLPRQHWVTFLQEYR